MNLEKPQIYSIKFPEMFSSVSTNVTEDAESTLQNIHLLFNSPKETLFGDPAFGTLIHNFLYEQNGETLREVVIDEIATELKRYIPQFSFIREQINIVQNREKLFVEVTGSINGSQPDLYYISLTDTPSDTIVK